MPYYAWEKTKSRKIRKRSATLEYAVIALNEGVIDTIVPEPLGGAHREPHVAILSLGDALEKALAPLLEKEGGVLRRDRRDKFLEMGKTGLA